MGSVKRLVRGISWSAISDFGVEIWLRSVNYALTLNRTRVHARPYPAD
jgi:hypothetical protein